jgi:hypothetical protein
MARQRSGATFSTSLASRDPRDRTKRRQESCRLISPRSTRVRPLETPLAAGHHWKDPGGVFTSRIGTPLDWGNVTRDFKALLNAAELPNIRLHDLRHSHAAQLLAQGVNRGVVMESLAHRQAANAWETGLRPHVTRWTVGRKSLGTYWQPAARPAIGAAVPHDSEFGCKGATDGPLTGITCSPGTRGHRYGHCISFQKGVTNAKGQ